MNSQDVSIASRDGNDFYRAPSSYEDFTLLSLRHLSWSDGMKLFIHQTICSQLELKNNIFHSPRWGGEGSCSGGRETASRNYASQTVMIILNHYHKNSLFPGNLIPDRDKRGPAGL